MVQYIETTAVKLYRIHYNWYTTQIEKEPHQSQLEKKIRIMQPC